MQEAYASWHRVNGIDNPAAPAVQPSNEYTEYLSMPPADLWCNSSFSKLIWKLRCLHFSNFVLKIWNGTESPVVLPPAHLIFEILPSVFCHAERRRGRNWELVLVDLKLNQGLVPNGLCDQGGCQDACGFCKISSDWLILSFRFPLTDSLLKLKLTNTMTMTKTPRHLWLL